MIHPITIESAGGEYMDAVLVLEWTRKLGEKVKLGDTIVVVETAKAATEIAAPHDGYLTEIVFEAGVEAPIGAVLGNISDTQDETGTAEAGNKTLSEAAPDPVVVDISAGPGVAMANDSRGRVIATPLARRIARQNGVDLTAVRGSGPNGRIKRRDVEAALASTTAIPEQNIAMPDSDVAASKPALGQTELKLFEEGSYELIPHDNMRRTIARRLIEAKSTVPHFYLTVDCRLDALLALRKQLNDTAPLKTIDGISAPAYRLSVNDMIIKAVSLALREVPDANVSWTEGGMVKHHHADVGVAVSIPGGLITPIVRRAEEKSLSAIASEMKDLAARARSRRLQPEEYQGGTTAVSNLGMFGVKEFAAIINPPHATIFAIGEGEQRPVVIDGDVKAATVMTVTVSTDHRAVDGALGAELIGAFKRLIESPFSLLV